MWEKIISYTISLALSGLTALAKIIPALLKKSYQIFKVVRKLIKTTKVLKKVTSTIGNKFLSYGRKLKVFKPMRLSINGSKKISHVVKRNLMNLGLKAAGGAL
jgi:hypothetical protein